MKGSALWAGIIIETSVFRFTVTMTDTPSIRRYSCFLLQNCPKKFDKHSI